MSDNPLPPADLENAAPTDVVQEFEEYLDAYAAKLADAIKDQLAQLKPRRE